MGACAPVRAPTYPRRAYDLASIAATCGACIATGRTVYPAFRKAVRAEKAEGKPIRLHIGRDKLGAPKRGKELKVELLYATREQHETLLEGQHGREQRVTVSKLTYGKHSFPFMGDAEGKGRPTSLTSRSTSRRSCSPRDEPADPHVTVLKLRTTGARYRAHSQSCRRSTQTSSPPRRGARNFARRSRRRVGAETLLQPVPSGPRVPHRPGRREETPHDAERWPMATPW